MPQCRYQFFPRTEPPSAFAEEVFGVFETHRRDISTIDLKKGLKSDEVLAIIAAELLDLGFYVESGKQKNQKIERPVFFGEQGQPTLKYEIDAYHPGWRCGLEVEAGRAWMGNAIYRDLVQAMVMVQVEVLALAVPLSYKYKSSGREVASNDFANATKVAEALYGHSRFTLPYKLLLIGY
jgi:hypothetical protein